MLQVLAIEWMGTIGLGFRMCRRLKCCRNGKYPASHKWLRSRLDVNAYGGQAPLFVTDGGSPCRKLRT